VAIGALLGSWFRNNARKLFRSRRRDGYIIIPVEENRGFRVSATIVAFSAIMTFARPSLAIPYVFFVTWTPQVAVIRKFG
jgi:hypothetical protein